MTENPYRDALVLLIKECRIAGDDILDADELEMIISDRLTAADAAAAGSRQHKPWPGRPDWCLTHDAPMMACERFDQRAADAAAQDDRLSFEYRQQIEHWRTVCDKTLRTIRDDAHHGRECLIPVVERVLAVILAEAIEIVDSIAPRPS